MTFGTICSGIEGAACALIPLDWEISFSAEVDKFASAVIAARVQSENLGDVTTAKEFPSVDVLVAGTPCQSFSVTGSRKGLADIRGQLAGRFAEIAAACNARWIVWENVVGVLSSGQGKDFYVFRRELAERGYRLAWRVLDSAAFGTPQRRRRVYVVGSRRRVGDAAAVLFAERPTDKPHPTTAREIRQSRNGSRCVGWNGDETPKLMIEGVPTLRASQGGEKFGYAKGGKQWRFTPEHLERLQGFPLGWTQLEGATDAQRYRALANAFHVDVIEWIGKRLEAVDNVH